MGEFPREQASSRSPLVSPERRAAAPDLRGWFAGAPVREAEERRFFLWIPVAAMGVALNLAADRNALAVALLAQGEFRSSLGLCIYEQQRASQWSPRKRPRAGRCRRDAIKDHSWIDRNRTNARKSAVARRRRTAEIPSACWRPSMSRRCKSALAA